MMFHSANLTNLCPRNGDAGGQQLKTQRQITYYTLEGLLITAKTGGQKDRSKTRRNRSPGVRGRNPTNRYAAAGLWREWEKVFYTEVTGQTGPLVCVIGGAESGGETGGKTRQGGGASDR